ncbi:AraC family transcriptional regulator [Gordoniibacillus kamchatkensis]|uniref:AraC family transcriptional regulator n=1 Tax=Gordoniibacillus kamchatkensis TaxID=1590651 RepID=UPI001E5CCA5D|nr:helix-turn-helix domain-containing protein [Paenibacillus sp. VKM B-2647]
MLKPVKDEELLATVDDVVKRLQDEWAQVLSHERTARMLRENLPQMRGNLLHELLEGRRYSLKELQDRMSMLRVPSFFGEPFRLMLVRLEEPFYTYDSQSLALLEYAVGNIAEELFAPHFELWPGKDSHDYLVYVVRRAGGPDAEESANGEGEPFQTLESTAAQWQSAVQTYLNGHLTILISRIGVFPDDLSEVYDTTLSALRKHVGAERDLIMTVAGERQEGSEVRSIPALYELPTMNQLLEAGQWETAGERVERIFGELRGKQEELHEHLLETYFVIASAASYYAHKTGRPLAGLLGSSYEKLIQGAPYRSWQQLYDWAADVLHRLRSQTEDEAKDSRTKLIEQVQRFVEQHLASDVSLTAIADHVFMHPVYISKIYKLETGENLSDYVNRVRMEKAAHMLLRTQDKIYEIAASIGYQRAHSFINVFKKHTGLTPQEYRDKYSNA